MKLFGRYLVQKKLVTPEQILEALDAQRGARQTTGQIAVRMCRLTPRQVLDVLNRQVLGDSRPFGEIAISLGYLKPDDVALLLEEQARSTQALGDVLVDLGFLSREVMERELQEFLLRQEP